MIRHAVGASQRLARRVVLGATLVAAFACSDSLSPDDFYGVWGGDNVRLTLSFTQGLFESSCWRGELALPVVTDGDQFEAIGTLTSQGGAGMSETRFATFIGEKSGDRLHLELQPASLGLGPYDLRLDEPVEIPGCP
jgi:hypothetical protein